MSANSLRYALCRLGVRFLNLTAQAFRQTGWAGVIGSLLYHPLQQRDRQNIGRPACVVSAVWGIHRAGSSTRLICRVGADSRAPLSVSARADQSFHADTTVRPFFPVLLGTPEVQIIEASQL